MSNTAINKKMLGVCLAIMMAAVSPLSMSQTNDTVYEYFAHARKGSIYVIPTANELQQAQRLFSKMFQGNINKTLKKEWNSLGFELLELEQKGKILVILRENKDKKWGRGFYIFKRQNKGNLLQAPHVFYDLHTGEIAMDLFFNHNFAAGGWNTVSRRSADLAHLKNTYFMAFSVAFAEAMPNNYVIQLHGFSQKKRKTEAGKTANIILSNGTRNPSAALKNMDVCLKNNVNEDTRIYPLNVRELGAVTNDIGKRLRAVNFQGFIHVEMSAAMRKQLLNQPDLIQKLKDCLPE